MQEKTKHGVSVVCSSKACSRSTTDGGREDAATDAAAATRGFASSAAIEQKAVDSALPQDREEQYGPGGVVKVELRAYTTRAQG